MNTFQKIGLAGGALLLGAGLALAQQEDYSKVQIKATKVSGPITLLEGAGGNMTVSSGDDGKLLVDDEFAPLAPKIKAALAKLGKGKLAWIVNTHFHGDHTGGNAIFGKDAPIVAQSNVRTQLEAGSEHFGNKTPPMEKSGLPVVTYDQQTSLWINGEEVRLTFYPHGHTGGDSMVWFTKSKVVSTGDDFTNGKFPFIDIAYGGDVENDVKNVADVLSKIDESWKVIPGHGPLGDRQALETFKKMLEDSIALVRTKQAKGETIEQIQSEGMPAEYKTWGEGGFVDGKTWVGMVAASLKANAK